MDSITYVIKMVEKALNQEAEVNRINALVKPIILNQHL